MDNHNIIYLIFFIASILIATLSGTIQFRLKSPSILLDKKPKLALTSLFLIILMIIVLLSEFDLGLNSKLLVVLTLLLFFKLIFSKEDNES